MSSFDMARSLAVTAAQSGTVKGRQVTNDVPHTLGFHVHLSPPKGRILVRLDGRNLTSWQGELASLTASARRLHQPTNQVAFGTEFGGWTVTSAKVKLSPINPLAR